MKSLKTFVILMLAVVFVLSVTLAFAAEKQWYVLKNKNGVCSVKQLKEKSPTTIAGPFATKADAQKAKDEKCPKPEKQKTPPGGKKY